MNVGQAISRHKFVSFLIGTAIVQALAFSAAFYLRAQGPILTPEPVTDSASGQLADAPAEIGAIVDATEPIAEPITGSSAGGVILPTSTVVHTVKRGETLSTIWNHHGAARSGGALAAKAPS